MISQRRLLPTFSKRIRYQSRHPGRMHICTYAHLIVCGVLMLGGATIFQRIMPDSVVSNHWLCVRHPHLFALHRMDPWILYPFPIQANSHVHAHTLHSYSQSR
jgi:hypothetical protein